MLVSDAVAAVLADFGVDTVFGVVGSGNFHVTNALIARGARFVPARHESGAASMADGWARLSGRPGILSVHQGPGLTNAVTGITEAAKSRTPLVVLAADVAASAVRSNFRIDVAALASAIGAVPARLHSPDFAIDDTVRAYRTAVTERRTVILALPLDVQAGECPVPSAELLDTARTALAGKRELLTGAARDLARGPGRRAQLLRDSAGDEAASHLAGGHPRGQATGVHRGPGCAERPGADGAGTASRLLRRVARHLSRCQGPVPRQPVGPGHQRRVRVTTRR